MGAREKTDFIRVLWGEIAIIQGLGQLKQGKKVIYLSVLEVGEKAV